jgi:2-polyprenyl-3-methyl-5-hydroxy-6-metoxy-1,4-benzoquinol methylase
MSLRKRSQAAEMMDADDLDHETYATVMGDLARVNRLTLAIRPTLAFLHRVARGRSRLRLLDVGFGDGDALRTISRWCASRGIDAELVGVDMNPRSAVAADRRGTSTPAIRYLTGDYADLAGRWDVVISSLVAHHMTRDQLVTFVRWMEGNTTCWFVNDLNRHRAAHLIWPWLAKAAGWHPIVRHDGRLSIARSYRLHEWPPILVEARASDCRVHRAFPFRLCVQGGADRL